MNVTGDVDAAGGLPQAATPRSSPTGPSSYRGDKGFDHLKVALSIGVQKMVRSDLAGSGVMFTIDTETGFRRGRGHQRRLGPGGERGAGHGRILTSTMVFKPAAGAGTTSAHHRKERWAAKEMKMVYAVRRQPAPPRIGRPARWNAAPSSSTDDEILQLARWAATIEDHYGTAHGHRVGQGRGNGQAIHRAGPAGNGAVPEAGRRLRRPMF